MDLEQLRALLAKAERFYQPEREPSIFALGGRGYYENPTTDLLAFFLNPAQVRTGRVLPHCAAELPAQYLNADA